MKLKIFTMKKGSNYACSAVAKIDSASKKEEKDYPHIFLKECKYLEKTSD